MDEYEFYAQDSWRLGDKLTLTGGLRYSLASPPWETNGLQVSPNVSLGERFKAARGDDGEGHPGEHAAGHPVRARGPGERKEGLLRLGQEQLCAPALGGLDADEQAGRAWRLLAGLRPHRSRPRAELRRGGLVRPVHIAHESVWRHQRGRPVGDDSRASTCCRRRCRPRRPEASLRLRRDSADIYETIDDTLVTPYAHTFNAVASFELTKNFNIEAAYVGRQGRNLLVQRDLFMPLNLVDPAVGHRLLHCRRLRSSSSSRPTASTPVPSRRFPTSRTCFRMPLALRSKGS